MESVRNERDGRAVDEARELRILRMDLDMTQEEFASRFHLGLRSLQCWEQRKSRPPKGTLYMIRRIIELEGAGNGLAAKPSENTETMPENGGTEASIA